MNNRLRLLVIGAGALLVVLVFTFPVWRPLFNKRAAAQLFPGLSPEQATAFAQLSPTQQKAYQQMIPTDATMAVSLAQMAFSPDNIVPTEQQATPQMTDPVVAATGAFTQTDPIHIVGGTVTIYQLPDNSRVMRFDDFHLTNGPDLHVILTKNPSPLTAGDVGNDYVELGSLKGNVGSQNYNIPSEVDFSQYLGVTIYSEQFHTVFTSAKLALS